MSSGPDRSRGPGSLLSKGRLRGLPSASKEPTRPRARRPDRPRSGTVSTGTSPESESTSRIRGPRRAGCLYSVPSDRATLAFFNPIPVQAKSGRSKLFKYSLLRRGTSHPAGHTRTAGPCPSISTSPAPKPDSLGTPVPPSPTPGTGAWKERERKNKKDAIPDAHGSEQGPGGIYLKYSIKHTTSGRELRLQGFEGH